VHHIESRKTGGDAPNNLITLCGTCHSGYHNGTVKLPAQIKRGMKFNDEAFMGIMRWSVYNKLKDIYPSVSNTYGYLTKNSRIRNNLKKEHYIDARCISGHPKAVSDGTVYYMRKMRRHNRQIHKCTINKGGIRKRNQAPYEIKGFRLYDKVKWNGKECFIYGRRATGRMDLRTLSGEHINASVGYKDLRLLEKRKGYVTEVRKEG
jgi:N6-L-threonylcarbamoyladenine synthase